jgi:hypothetical protein
VTKPVGVTNPVGGRGANGGKKLQKPAASEIIRTIRNLQFSGLRTRVEKFAWLAVRKEHFHTL